MIGRAVRSGVLAAALGLAGCTALPVSGPATVSGDGAERSGDVVAIPYPAAGVAMRATLHRPEGPPPHPLAVIAHGSEQDPLARGQMPPPRFPALTAWLVARGYAVLLPERPGHGGTGGPYLEDQGSCARPDYRRSANAVADSLAVAIAWARTQPGIAAGPVLVIGNSAGGWGAVALAARDPAQLAGVVSIAGGRGGRNRGRPHSNCAADALVAAAADFGRTARVPALWLYADNDTYFPPDLSRRMAAAYRGGGAPLDYRLLPPIPGDGHRLAGDIDAYSAVLGDFLDGL